MAPKETGTNMNPLFETCVRHITCPQVDITAPFSMLVTQIDSHPFFGKLLVGRVQTGSIKTGDMIGALDAEGTMHAHATMCCEWHVISILTCDACLVTHA